MAGARPILIRMIILVFFLLAVWLLAGRRISMLLDFAFTVQPESLPVKPLSVHNSTFWTGEVPLSVSDTAGGKSDATLRSDDSSKLVVSLNGKAIVLGTLTPARGPSEFLDGALAPEPGDQVTLTVRRSFMSWPTPFEMNYMTGHSPSWKRYLYYHLKWKKRSGAQLEMVWRYQQWYYSTLGGWSNGMMTGPGTGLIGCKIDPERGQ
jgi:hypothetical protein